MPVSGASYLPAEPPRCRLPSGLRCSAEAGVLVIRRFNTEGRSAPTDTTASRRWRGWTTWTGCLGWVRDMRYFVLHAPRQTGKTSALLALRDVPNAGAAGELHCMYVNVEPAQAVREDVHSAMQVIVGEVASRARASGDGFLYEAWPAIFAAFGARALQDALSCLGGGIQAAGGAHRRDRHPDRGCAGVRAAAASRRLRSAPRALPAERWCCAGSTTCTTTVSGRTLERSSPRGARSTSRRSRCVSAAFRRRSRGLLLAQHTEEAGQAFMSKAIATVRRQTQGQPWLVNALSERACFRGEASRDCTRPITEPAILVAQEQLILAQRRKLKTSEESLCRRHVWCFEERLRTCARAR